MKSPLLYSFFALSSAIALSACGGGGGSTGNSSSGPVVGGTGFGGGASGGGTTGGGTGGTGGGGVVSQSASCAVTSTGTGAEITGVATYDHVPNNPATNGLDYSAITEKPIRGAVVRAVNGAGEVLASACTDSAGAYALTLPSGSDVRVQVLSQIALDDTASYDVSVVDNSNGNNVYAMQGALETVAAGTQERLLNASSGWTGTDYNDTQRVAAPFAILDTIYTTMNSFIAVDSNVDFPQLNIGWSYKNNTALIGTSSYNSQTGQINILGDQNIDTDEYDRHIIVHEWGHYFEDQLSRSDSIGFQHALDDLLDPRVALGEGFGNALSAIILDDPTYVDSGGFQQAGGFSFSIENNNNTNSGWYNEGSVQSIIYDVYDANSDGADNLTLGLGPIYQALTSPDYINQDSFTTIFSFMAQLAIESPSSAVAITDIALAQSINGTGYLGENETNDGGNPNTLDLYKTLTVGGTPTMMCSTGVNGEFNKLGVHDYALVDIAAAGNYRFTATVTEGPASSNPEMVIYTGNEFQGYIDNESSNLESGIINLDAGVSRVAVYDVANYNPTSLISACYSVSVMPN